MNMNEQYIYSNYSSECQFHLLQCLLLFYTQVTFRCASLVHHHSTNQARLAKAVGDPKIPSLFPLEVAANGGVVPIDLLSRRFGVCKKNDGERNRPFNDEVRDWTLDIKQLNLPSCRFSLVAQEEPEKLMTCSRNRLIDLFPNMALNIVVLSQEKLTKISKNLGFLCFFPDCFAQHSCEFPREFLRFPGCSRHFLSVSHVRKSDLEYEAKFLCGRNS